MNLIQVIASFFISHKNLFGFTLIIILYKTLNIYKPYLFFYPKICILVKFLIFGIFMNNIFGQFPTTRLRRTRTNSWLRDMLCETRLNVADFILPLFVMEGNEYSEIPSMPGVYRYGIEPLIFKIKEAKNLGIKAIALFPVVSAALKSDDAKEALNENSLICRAVKAIKAEIDGIGIICDVALDPYTTHGHDGILIDNYVDNDMTNAMLCQQSLTLVRAGCDIIAPSDMMDGRIGKIRDVLDKNGYINTPILSYAVKYASNFYGPFRDAVGSKNAIGKSDKRTYQMQIANSDEAIREAALDINEGADILMVKPGLPYLDIIYRLKNQFNVPIFAYQVSGEYAMIKAAAQNNWLDEKNVVLESLIAFKRSGANAIITYFAMDAAHYLA